LDYGACVVLADAQFALQIHLRAIVVVHTAPLIPKAQAALVFTDISRAWVVVVALCVAAAALLERSVVTGVGHTRGQSAGGAVGALEGILAAIFEYGGHAGVVDAEPRSTRSFAALTVFRAAIHFGGEDAVPIRTDADAAGIIADTFRVLFTARPCRGVDALVVDAFVGGTPRKVVAIRVGKATPGDEGVLAASVGAGVFSAYAGVFAFFVIETAFGGGDPGFDIAGVIGAYVGNTGVSVVAITVGAATGRIVQDGGFTLTLGVAGILGAAVTIIAGGVVGTADSGICELAHSTMPGTFIAGVFGARISVVAFDVFKAAGCAYGGRDAFVVDAADKNAFSTFRAIVVRLAAIGDLRKHAGLVLAAAGETRILRGAI